MRIITISREFGSGGRELGKRLADLLKIDYYDKEIITKIAENNGLNPGYVENILENHGWQDIPLTFGHSFMYISPFLTAHNDLLKQQKEIIEKIVKKGKDFIIIGSNADKLLEKHNPFKIFVCAQMDAKVKRCVDRQNEDENLSEKEIIKMIKRIDKNRRKSHELLSDTKLGDPHEYDLVVNTTNWSIKALTPLVKEYVEKWFEEKNK